MHRLLMPALACVTLGLAPFVPEPHVIGKLRWVLGGAHGMSPVDWFDLALHGAPWVWLVVVAITFGVDRRSGEDGSSLPLVLVLLAIGAAVACVVWSLVAA